MSTEDIKRALGYKAAELIKPNSIVGLGTGTTAYFFIEALIEKQKQGLKIQAVATSTTSSEQAKLGRIPLLDINTLKSIDVTVDGADEVDPQKRLIKGAGGALLREKIIASMSKELIIIIDNTKMVERLGKRALPVEVVPFGALSTQDRLKKKGFKGSFRKNKEGSIYITDNGNYLIDIEFESLRDSPEEDDRTIRSTVGVVETGFFFNLATQVIVGSSDGKINLKTLK